MKKMLEKHPVELYHLTKNKRLIGANPDQSGDCSELSGDCTGLRGDLDLCEISDAERASGVDISGITK